MLHITEILVDRSVTRARFACDLGRCKGSCCTMPGGQGAPLEEAEVQLVRDAEKAAFPYLPELNRLVIEIEGSVEGDEGNRTTRCIDDRDCVFVYYQGDVAKCAIERAWLEGKSEFRKPLSCHLFPIRVDDLFGSHRLRYERISECKPAVERGKEEGIALVDFLKEPLIRAFGEEFYAELLKRKDV